MHGPLTPDSNPFPVSCSGMDDRPLLRRPITWIIAVVVAVLLVAVVAPFVYINVIKEDAPERLSFDDVPTADGTDDTSDTSDTGDTGDTTGTAPTGSDESPSSGESLDGTWTVSDGSQVGYRVAEILFGQETEAVGRTSEVTGELTVDGTTITATEFVVDMTTVTSDESRRDGQFNGRIMETATFPTGTFTLTEPIELDAIPADLEEVTVTATGELTLHGVTNEVSVDLLTRRNGDTIEVNGTIPITFADYDIDNPSGGPAQVGDEGELEILLVFSPTG